MIKSKQYEWNENKWESSDSSSVMPQLCLVFGSRFEVEKYGVQAIRDLKSKYPETIVVTTSTAGNILGNEIKDKTLIATCISFEKTEVNVQSFETGLGNAKKIGKLIANSYQQEKLVYLLLLSTSEINAGNLIEGINSVFKGSVIVSGGVAGDDVRFEKTLVGADGDIKENNIVTIGFYSDHLEVSNGSKGGWSTFGPKSEVTKSEANVLYEIDNQPVLAIYKEYLGKKAKELPGSGLLFPFAIIDKNTGEYTVRGVQDVNEEEESISFFGNISEGETVQLMRADIGKLLDGASDSAKEGLLTEKLLSPQLAILVSCVARRLALNQLIEEELEEVREVYGEETTICGFYSYSELAPVKGSSACRLHNQTLTLTTLYRNFKKKDEVLQKTKNGQDY